MRLTRPIALVAEKIYYTGNLLQQFVALVSGAGQTYFPASVKKGRWSILRDHIYWIIRNHEINRFYYVYGLDRKHQQKSASIIGYRRFRRLRDRANLRPDGLNFNYACLMRDKYVFGQFLNSLNVPSPKNIALLDKNGVTWLETMQTDSYETFLEHLDKPIDAFCKRLRGIRGEGAFPLRFEKGKIYSGHTEISAMDLKSKIDGLHLLQERITQHPAMARLHPHSLNTIRIVTFNSGGNVELFFAAVRVGTNQNNVDNWNAGGIAIAVNTTTGTLREQGLQKWCYGKLADAHPNTGITFAGYEIPFFKESVELVTSTHRHLYGIHSIGWDVAIETTGPIIVEANEDWDGSFAMCSEDNFKEKFMKMFEKQ